ncbi:hypothetical protein N1F73_03725, partial [Mycoplasma sp. HS2188]
MSKSFSVDSNKAFMKTPEWRSFYESEWRISADDIFLNENLTWQFRSDGQRVSDQEFNKYLKDL